MPLSSSWPKCTERYAISFQSMPAQRRKWATSLLLNILGDPLISIDLSILLNVDPANLENTLSSSPSNATAPLEHWELDGQ